MMSVNVALINTMSDTQASGVSNRTVKLKMKRTAMMPKERKNRWFKCRLLKADMLTSFFSGVFILEPQPFSKYQR